MNSVNKIKSTAKVLLPLIFVGMLLWPQQAAGAAAEALQLWWQAIVPALLPFFICFELFMALDTVQGWARPLEALMRPLFALPGAASLAVVLGFCCGFPSGAVIAAALRRRGQISREEAARLIAFTNNASPLYISLGVAGGILGCRQAAPVLLFCQYSGNLLWGLLLSLGKRRHPGPSGPYVLSLPPAAGRPAWGLLLKESARQAAENVTLIGCYMCFFSVLTALLLSLWQLAAPAGVGQGLSAAVAGFWEMSLGVKALADLPLQQALPWTALILAWGGVSVQAQVAAMVAGGGVSLRWYFLGRVFHCLYSYAMARFLLSFLPLPAAAWPVTGPEPSVFCFGGRGFWP
ncbi:MAG: hypothetical protein K6B40_01455 [Firmicutes bacterium]|nr:hypothetical protein [Bacillota bacterium]